MSARASDPIRALVCGGRTFRDKALLFSTLDRIKAERGIAVIIHGNADGADYLAGRWAGERPVHVESYTANWHGDGRAAGVLRNQRMINEGKPDLVVAFPGGDRPQRCRAHCTALGAR